MKAAITTKEPRITYHGMELYSSIFPKLQSIREAQQGNVTKKQLEYFKGLVDSFRIDLKYKGGLLHGSEQDAQKWNNKTGRLFSALTDYDTKYESLIRGLEEPFM